MGFVYECLQLFLVTNVARDRGGTTFAIAAVDRRTRFLALLDLAARDDDARTVIRERVRHRQTHAFRCAGEHRNAIVQIEETHAFPLLELLSVTLKTPRKY